MAFFWTEGRAGVVILVDSPPTLNSYSFFDHQLLYASGGSYSEELVRGERHDLGIFGDKWFVEQLTGTGLTVQMSGSFALTGGTVTGFHEENDSAGRGFVSLASWTATGFSVDATVFWSFASAGQWHELWMLAAAGNDAMSGSDVATASDFIEGGAGNDVITAQAGDDALWGNAGQDSLFGGDGSDILVGNDWGAPIAVDLWSAAAGGAGSDHIYTGGYGHGALDGGDGSDWLWGGPDADVLTGGTGIDYMAGGFGRDIFEVTATGDVTGEYDFIRDFQDGVDFIKLPSGPTWYVSSSAYGAIISSPGTGFYLVVQYATAAMVSDQIYYA
jgi:Ca2+-binding RTX toxin-like protein